MTITLLAKAAKQPEKSFHSRSGASKVKLSRKQMIRDVKACGRSLKNKDLRLFSSLFTAEKAPVLDTGRVIFTPGWAERWEAIQARQNAPQGKRRNAAKTS